ncbi:MAG: Gfo/Idh/MocA family oxidoreductase [Proteiniphilum sp.]
MKKENNVTRRKFLKTSAVAGTVGMLGTGTAGLFASCSSQSEKSKNVNIPLREPGSYYIPELPDLATDGIELKAGLIGCGSRGSGAAMNFLNAANGVTIVSICDIFQEKVDTLAEKLKSEKNIDIPIEKRFWGLDAYKQVIDSGIDLVIVATPPFFRPEHFKYAVEKNIHCFLEKPICVDAAGYRTVVAAAKQAQAKKLCVVTGTQRHHQRSYVESFKQIMNGAIGEITGGTVYWNQRMLWYRDRNPQWNDFEYMVHDWVNWKWLSGDHIVEQHVHNIDVFTWFTGLRPKSAVGFGSRHRRVTGDQYDNFSIDFTMENGIHLHSMCRQIDGCANNVSEFIQGSKGSWSSREGHVIRDLNENIIWQYDEEAEKENFKQTDPYTLEHVNLINCVRKNTPIEQATETTISNMAAIMGRESAYTGQEVTWDEMTAASQNYTPVDLNMGKMDMTGFTVPIPGSEKKSNTKK